MGTLLKLDNDDPQAELEFSVNAALSVHPNERLSQWLDWNLSMLEFIKQQELKNELSPSDWIVKRPAS